MTARFQMNLSRLTELLESARGITVGVIGDFCLDAYWTLDTACDELSVETGIPVKRVLEQAYAPGGASNVAANLAALGLGGVEAFGVIGPDIFGKELVRQLAERGAACAGLLVQERDWNTTVYAKPRFGEEELSRFDFGTVNEIAPHMENALVAALTAALPSLDALIVNQQLPKGYHSENVIQALNAIAAEHDGCPILLDTRHKSAQFVHMIVKLNALEAAERLGEPAPPDTLEGLKPHARVIHADTARPVIITHGALGMAVFDGETFTPVHAAPIVGTTDPVGAGDTAIAAIAAMLGAGAALTEAAEIANLATGVTVRKLRQTGTASPAEILAALGT